MIIGQDNYHTRAQGSVVCVKRLTVWRKKLKILLVEFFKIFKFANKRLITSNVSGSNKQAREIEVEFRMRLRNLFDTNRQTNTHTQDHV